MLYFKVVELSGLSPDKQCSLIKVMISENSPDQTGLFFSRKGYQIKTMMGVLLDSTHHKTQVNLGDYTFNVRHEYSWAYAQKSEGETPRVGGMIIMLAPDEFLIAGSGIIVTFETRASDDTIAGIASIDEGRFFNGIWTPGRRMNGDQSHQGRHLHLPGGTYGIQKIKLYTYK